MGCCCATVSVETPIKIPAVELPKVPSDRPCFIIGLTPENQPVFYKVDLSVPKLVSLDIPPNFQPYNHSSMLQINAKQYFISGGVNADFSEITSHAWIYSIATHQVEPVAQMGQFRYCHTALLLRNSVYVLGGRQFGNDQMGILNKCESYSLESKVWRSVPDMSVTRCAFFAFVWNSYIYAMGGYTGTQERSTKIERFAEGNRNWETLNIELPRGVQAANVFSVNPNQITIFGGHNGQDFSRYVNTINLEQMSIIATGQIIAGQSALKCFNRKDNFYFVGGHQSQFIEKYNLRENKSELQKIQIYLTQEALGELTACSESILVEYRQKQTKNMQFSLASCFGFGSIETPFIVDFNPEEWHVSKKYVPMNLRLGHCFKVVTIEGFNCLIIGGATDYTLCQSTNQILKYDLVNGVVDSNLRQMKEGRYHFACCSLEGSGVYVFGGVKFKNDLNEIALASCEKYNLSSNSWESVLPLPFKLSRAHAIASGKLIYVLGGFIGKELNRTVLLLKNGQWIKTSVEIEKDLEILAICKIKSTSYCIYGVENTRKRCFTFQLNFYDQLHEALPTITKIDDYTTPQKINRAIAIENGGGFFIVFGENKFLEIKSFNQETQKKIEKLQSVREQLQLLREVIFY